MDKRPTMIPVDPMEAVISETEPVDATPASAEEKSEPAYPENEGLVKHKDREAVDGVEQAAQRGRTA